jgi:hypothetical protein
MRIADSTDLRDYIVHFQNLLSVDTCEQIIEWAKAEPSADNAWEGFEVAKSALTNTENVIMDTRTCDYTMLGPNRGPCWDRLELALHHIIEHYPYVHKATDHTGIQLIRYGHGHHFEEHVDSYGGAPRILSSSIMLNNDYEGGELTFWQDQYQSQTHTAGDAIVFPSNFAFPHAVKPVKNGIRYVLVVWFV